ncbi:GHKL domain-containing protein [Facklamia sp. DSM 111018]|uniref:histidine kinase n=1 Tax=Facklamia lactis TaxID=2749967 RepID=A0ABS0LSF8_9LACT|nr:ATP-binding protein [Facklamia lactis]MBG9981450.1 GHKL domain-containing protein [Facklamia lactis]MBG9987074.1 GHKL domain-containing protein [Facklamia lactis]
MRSRIITDRNWRWGIGILLAILGIIILGLFSHDQVTKGIYNVINQKINLHLRMIIDDQSDITTDTIIENLQEISQHTDHESQMILISESELLDNSKVKEPLWTNYKYQSGQINYTELKEALIHKTDQSGAGINWQQWQIYYTALSFPLEQDRIWLIERYPGELFKDYWLTFWLVLLSWIILGIMIVLFSFQLFISKITTPIHSIEEGLKKLSQGDYHFEYLERSIPEVDHLGWTVSQVIQELAEDRTSFFTGQQQFSLLLENINLGVMVINPEGKIDMFNPALQDILLVDPSVIGRHYQTTLKSFQLINLINNVAHTKKPVQEEVEVYVPKSKFVDVNILTYREHEKQELSILVLLYDITEIRRLETVRTEFVANASHELRTPVTAIKGFAETLLSGALEDREMAQKFVNIIANESNRLEIIIEDILELSRVERNNQVSSDLVRFDLVEVAYNMIEFLSQKMEAKSIQVQLKSDEKVPFQGDQHRVEQILTNLLDNAINYSEHGSKITVVVKAKKKMVLFSIEDTGIGIPEQEIDRIFERFYRVDKARSRNSGGTGLGLSIVRNLVKTMDGKIEVKSKLGRGTKFTVTLPYKY